MQKNNIKLLLKNQWFHLIISLCWLTIGIILRTTNLADKSASSIEIATLGYSLGHSFFDLPLDQIITLNQLLSPLQFESTSTATDVIHQLLREDTHPPLYFVLNHLWFNLFSTDGEIVSLWVGRSLSAILGVATIVAIFALGWLAFCPLVGHIAATLMAISPYGIYLAQESRHHTLTILWIIASITCLIAIVPYLKKQRIFPTWLGAIWITINSLGIATHYIFILVLATEGLVIGGFWLKDIQNRFQSYWWRIYLVALGTFISCLVWLPVVINATNNQLTGWISTSFDLDEFWYPIPRLLGWILTMVWLLPIEGTSLFVTILSGVTLLVALVWVAPNLWRGGKAQMNDIQNRLSFQIFVSFFVGAIALFLVIIYGMGRDLSLAARYQFVYFPIVIILLAAILAKCWNNSENQTEVEKVVPDKQTSQTKKEKTIKKDLIITSAISMIVSNLKPINKRVVIVVLLIGLWGGLTVVNNYGYQRSRRADLLVEQIKTKSKAALLVATTYQTHAEIRALIALGLELKRQEEKTSISEFFQPRFVLVKRPQNQKLTPDSNFAKFLSTTSRPIDLWGVNFKVEADELENFNCRKYSGFKPKVNGYRYRLYHCR